MPTPEEIRAERARRARGSLAHWCRLCDPDFERPPHIHRLIGELEAVERGDTKRLLVAMPPRHGKSHTTTELFPGFYLGRHPKHRVVIASHTSDLAEDFSRVCRRTIETHGRTVFDIELDPASQAVNRWDLNRTGGGLKAVGVGGPLTGRGAHLLLIDDPIKDLEQAYSPAYREQVWRWYQTVARTRLAPGGVIVLIMTRWHQDDLAGRVLKLAEQRGGIPWKRVEMPIYDESRVAAGESRVEAQLWPGRYDEDEIQDLEVAAGPYGWQALFFQRPVNPGGNILKRGWFRWYTTDPSRATRDVEYIDTAQLDFQIQSWDCAFKDTDGTDYVAGTVWGALGSKRILLDLLNERLDLPGTCSALRSMSARWPMALGKLIENKANGPAVVQTMDAEVGGLVEAEPMGSKEARVHACAPLFKAGNVYVPHDAPWVHAYITQLCDFPSAEFDDMVDSTTQALLHMNLEAAAMLRAKAMVEE